MYTAGVEEVSGDCMRNTVRMIVVLTVIGFISGATLVSVYKYASPLIAKNQKNEIEKAFFRIFPEADNYERRSEGNKTIFEAKDKNSKVLGYAFLAEGNGYQGAIKLMAGIKPDLETIVGIDILESQETPGLGQEIANDDFKSQFKGLKSLPAITYVKNKKPGKPNEIRAITGATVSSSAVVSILNEEIAGIKEILK